VAPRHPPITIVTILATFTRLHAAARAGERAGVVIVEGSPPGPAGSRVDGQARRRTPKERSAPSAVAVFWYDRPNPMLLYRPVGLNELRLMYQAELRTFPPRLPEQPIFYPVTNEGYARQIARDWNTKSETLAGFVTRFAVEDAYAARFPRRVVGAREHEELWVPAEDLADFNARLEGPIEVIGAFFGDGFAGEVPERGALGGQDATAQLVTLARRLAVGGADLAGEIAADHQAVFLNAFFWAQHDFAAQGIGAEERDRALDHVRRSWAQGSRAALPLGVVG
jgi:hypothetical protein